MADKINSFPQITPAYNPFLLVLDSTNKTKTGFKYILDIKNEQSGEFVRRLKIQPNPFNSNYGAVDISKIFQDNLSGDPMSRALSYIGINWEQQNTFTAYIGEEYLYEWNFKDNAYNIAAPYIGRVGFTGDTNHTFVVGDWIHITQSGTPTYDEYNGVNQVLYKEDKSVFIDYPYLGATVPEGGTIRYQNYKNIEYSGQTSYSANTFDGVFEDFHLYNWYEDYLNVTATTRFLTIVTSGNTDYKVRLSNGGFTNVYMPAAQNTTSKLNVVYKCDDILLTATTATSESPSTNYLFRIPFAPNSINEKVGYNFISGSSYSFMIVDINEVPLTEEYVLNVDSSCSPDSDNGWTELLFEDKLSSYIPINLKMVKDEVLSINKKEHKRALDYSLDSNSRYVYDVNSQAKKIYDIDIQREYVVTTGYVGEKMIPIIESLLTSKNVYWKNSNGEYIPVSIKNNSMQKKTSLRNACEIEYDITFIPQIYGELNI